MKQQGLYIALLAVLCPEIALELKQANLTACCFGSSKV